MKKFYVITVFLLLMLTTQGFSQDEQKSVWYVGIGGNFNVTWILNQNTYGQSFLNSKTTFGYIGNVNIGCEFSDHWGFKFEVGYAQMGQKYEDTRDNEPVKRDITLNYTLLPLLFKYRVGGETAKFYIMAGPQLGILVKAKQSYTVNGEPAPEYKGIDVSKEDIMDRCTKAAAFLRLDFGLELTPGKHIGIDIGLSGAYSITDLNQESWRMNDVNGDYKLSHNLYAGLNLGLNYKF
ncbi:MAG TPA: porin family protein [Bacteroidales bacterium]|nr:porin family protein [Bacteroidales bacterium]